MARLHETRFLLIACACVTLAGLASHAGAQIPDKFTNLKILPKTISKGELVTTMRGYAGGLGVRCNYCHDGPENLKGMNFASDAKKTKQSARAMMSMVNEINGKLIPKAGIENPVQVKCVTCHHGVTRPQSLAEILETQFGKGGMDSLTVTYRELRQKYYGGAAYDFTPPTLGQVAEWLAGQKKTGDAIAVMKFNIEQDPKEAYSYNLLGRLQTNQGDKEGAVSSFKKALELDPNDTWSAELLQKLQTPPAK